MEETIIQEGLVGFFDILGYQSFLDNNDAEVATSEVLSVINGVSPIIAGKILGLTKGREKDKQAVKSIEWLIFSDTILMLMNWDSKEVYKWTVFLMAASILCQHMFESGLPLRGAIRVGKYLTSQTCFAGRTIVEAYRAAASLNLAACVIDEEVIRIPQATIRPESQAEFDDIVDGISVKYMTPLKNDQYSKLRLLDYMMSDSTNTDPIQSDVRQMVLDSFWSHNKDMNPSADVKANNTEKFLRFLQNSHARPSRVR